MKAKKYWILGSLVVCCVAVALVSVLLGWCRKERINYGCTVTITPAENKDGSERLYEAVIELTEIRTARAGESKIIIFSPKLTCAPGHLAKISAWEDEQEQTGISATVFIPELEAGGTAQCFVHLKENGHTKFLSDFQLTLQNKPAAAGG
ncbi:MAG: hypothetical protein ACYS6W_15540 [Planctomycetota bacterium]|jgi:hypothetical protein